LLESLRRIVEEGVKKIGAKAKATQKA